MSTSQLIMVILSFYTRWIGLSRKTISRYCPFKIMRPAQTGIRDQQDMNHGLDCRLILPLNCAGSPEVVEDTLGDLGEDGHHRVQPFLVIQKHELQHPSNHRRDILYRGRIHEPTISLMVSYEISIHSRGMLGLVNRNRGPLHEMWRNSTL